MGCFKSKLKRQESLELGDKCKLGQEPQNKNENQSSISNQITVNHGSPIGDYSNINVSESLGDASAHSPTRFDNTQYCTNGECNINACDDNRSPVSPDISHNSSFESEGSETFDRSPISPDISHNSSFEIEGSEKFDILNVLMFPVEWSSCSIYRTELVDISPLSTEGESVRKFFNRSSRSKDFKLHISDIARIENPFMHSYYLLKKHEMEARNEHVDELYLYHGTKRKNLNGILEDNLNWRLYSEKHLFGQGVSFSPLATYSSHYCDKSDDMVMLLCKVLTANSVIGSRDMQIPPFTDKVVYDTSIKDDASVIVKYSDHEFYPLYKISCVKILRNS